MKKNKCKCNLKGYLIKFKTVKGVVAFYKLSTDFHFQLPSYFAAESKMFREISNKTITVRDEETFKYNGSYVLLITSEKVNLAVS